MKKNNYCLFVLEFFAAIFVVFIHCKFPGIFGDFIETVARFSVPFFFIVTGYFSFYSDKTKIKEKIKKFVFILIMLFLLYFLYDVFYYIFLSKNSVLYFFENTFTFKNIVYFLVFNNTTPVASHLWFLAALIYCYIFLYFYNDYKQKIMKIFMIIPVFTIPISAIIIYKFGMEYSTIFRNWLFIGMPFISIGGYIKNNKEKILKINNKINIYIILFSIFLICVERIILKYTLNIKLNLYYGAMLLSIFIFIYCVKNPYRFKKLSNYLIGYSANIYYFHYLIVKIFDDILFFKYYNYILKWLEPFLVVVITLIICFVIKLIKNRKVVI